jgi:hypothetical protein
MTGQSFSLIPFPAPQIPEISISGQISRQDGVLTLRYTLRGKMDEILLPLPSPHAERRDELWRATCFEFFLAIKNQPGYWEFNMSPSGDWNIYHMDAYRRIGFREETSIQRLQFEAREQSEAFVVDAILALDPIAQQHESLEVGIAAILQTRDGSETYWALRHPAAQADFHLRESFILVLEGQNHPAEQSDPVD